MMKLEEVAEHLSTLEGVHQREHCGLLRWTVKGRLVARQLDADTLLGRLGRRILDTVAPGFAERESLIAEHPETFTVRPRFEAHLMVVAELVNASPAAVRDALDAAWSLQTTGAV